MTKPDQPKRLRVAVLYGGRSTEHEISLQSAAAVVANLDPAQYEVIPISVDKQGRFHRHALPVLDAHNPRALVTDSSSDALTLAARPGPLFVPGSGDEPAPAIDVVFPVMHGPLCEDGSIQGLLELAAIPYVGARVLGSAIGMDKDVAKRLARAAGLEVAPYVTVQQARWDAAPSEELARIERELDYPVFVKPATLGSSVGVSRAGSRQELENGIALALRYDSKLLVEKAVDAREIEFAVLSAENLADPPEVSVPGEIVAREAFYSFERKYLDSSGAELLSPAPLDPALTAAGQRAARDVFLALECEGMARADFFLERPTGRLLFNEINTIPGFTAISMYPKLWEASGLPYARLLDRLIRHAMGRHACRSKLQRER